MLGFVLFKEAFFTVFGGAFLTFDWMLTIGVYFKSYVSTIFIMQTRRKHAFF